MFVIYKDDSIANAAYTTTNLMVVSESDNYLFSGTTTECKSFCFTYEALLAGGGQVRSQVSGLTSSINELSTLVSSVVTSLNNNVAAMGNSAASSVSDMSNQIESTMGTLLTNIQSVISQVQSLSTSLNTVVPSINTRLSAISNIQSILDNKVSQAAENIEQLSSVVGDLNDFSNSLNHAIALADNADVLMTQTQVLSDAIDATLRNTQIAHTNAISMAQTLNGNLSSMIGDINSAIKEIEIKRSGDIHDSANITVKSVSKLTDAIWVSVLIYSFILLILLIISKSKY